MNKELTNDENIANLKKRKILRLVIILFATLTIILALLTIITEWFDVGFKVSVIFALITYIITTILGRMRSKIPINRNDEFDKIREEIKKTKRSNKKDTTKKKTKKTETKNIDKH